MDNPPRNGALLASEAITAKQQLSVIAVICLQTEHACTRGAVVRTPISTAQQQTARYRWSVWHCISRTASSATCSAWVNGAGNRSDAPAQAGDGGRRRRGTCEKKHKTNKTHTNRNTVPTRALASTVGEYRKVSDCQAARMCNEAIAGVWRWWRRRQRRYRVIVAFEGHAT